MRHEPRAKVDWRVRLTSLSLQGFKSFGNRTVVEFAPGITAIIGPNGSGKSNLIDALKWTTGGGRAREFRASDKTDLIFHGASGKRGLSLAEVEVELRGDERAFKVYRSLDRDGTTRLRLNGRNARFLDLEEALAGSGLGRSGVALIGQGEVSQVLMADPPKLLQYVAEVAGVGRMSSRREQTQARLETARGHLDRLQDVLVELDERCVRLGEEAADAERHAALSAEALRLRVTASRRRVDALEQEIAGLLSSAARSCPSPSRRGASGSRSCVPNWRGHAERATPARRPTAAPWPKPSSGAATYASPRSAPIVPESVARRPGTPWRRRARKPSGWKRRCRRALPRATQHP